MDDQPQKEATIVSDDDDKVEYISASTLDIAKNIASGLSIQEQLRLEWQQLHPLIRLSDLRPDINVTREAHFIWRSTSDGIVSTVYTDQPYEDPMIKSIRIISKRNHSAIESIDPILRRNETDGDSDSIHTRKFPSKQRPCLATKQSTCSRLFSYLPSLPSLPSSTTGSTLLRDTRGKSGNHPKTRGESTRTDTSPIVDGTHLKKIKLPRLYFSGSYDVTAVLHADYPHWKAKSSNVGLRDCIRQCNVVMITVLIGDEEVRVYRPPKEKENEWTIESSGWIQEFIKVLHGARYIYIWNPDEFYGHLRFITKHEQILQQWMLKTRSVETEIRRAIFQSIEATHQCYLVTQSFIMADNDMDGVEPLIHWFSDAYDNNRLLDAEHVALAQLHLLVRISYMAWCGPFAVQLARRKQTAHEKTVKRRMYAQKRKEQLVAAKRAAAAPLLNGFQKLSDIWSSTVPVTPALTVTTTSPEGKPTTKSDDEDDIAYEKRKAIETKSMVGGDEQLPDEPLFKHHDVIASVSEDTRITALKKIVDSDNDNNDGDSDGEGRLRHRIGAKSTTDKESRLKQRYLTCDCHDVYLSWCRSLY